MIENILINHLKIDPQLVKYVKDNIFAISAPDGTHTPYIIVKDSATSETADIITSFNISVDIYDYNTDKRKIISASQRIKNLLNWETGLEDPNGIYSSIRVWHDSTNIVDGDDPNLTISSLSFSARACENIVEEN